MKYKTTSKVISIIITLHSICRQIEIKYQITIARLIYNYRNHHSNQNKAWHKIRSCYVFQRHCRTIIRKLNFTCSNLNLSLVQFSWVIISKILRKPSFCFQGHIDRDLSQAAMRIQEKWHGTARMGSNHGNRRSKIFRFISIWISIRVLTDPTTYLYLRIPELYYIQVKKCVYVREAINFGDE